MIKMTNFTNIKHVYQDTSVSVGRSSGDQGIRFNLISFGLISLSALSSRPKGFPLIL
jgi:hypothetical protein